MPKAFVDLDMNGNDVNNAANVNATTEVRANTNFNHNGTNGITQLITIADDSAAVHTFTFTQGILTNYSVAGMH